MAVFGPAATLASNAPSELAVIYLRLALYLDPENGMARQLLGDMLAQDRLDLDALVVYSEAEPVSPFYISSKIAEAWTLLRLERADSALATLQALVDETQSPRARRALADALRSVDRFDDALAIYQALVAEAQAAGAPVDWDLYYARGIAYERTGRWPLAEADFQSALAIVPNEAQVLNYLGYTWVDRGERLEEAFDMIRRAVALEPDEGYIVDSLGWAHFKRGEYEIAVQHLERAVELDPQDPTINEHLGDAYWRVGRLLEASYQWRRSLTLDPDEKLRLALEDKLANGLPSLGSESVLASP
jgi:Flp pilus assembly protein TadD